ncbi:MAG: hypothetical protein AB8B55_00630 [Mariniblastus sp.]
MPFLIGTDEAGYGPNLGPLTVTGTLWGCPNEGEDLYQSLASIFTNQGKRDSAKKLFIADSKKVYSSSGSIAALETSVLSLVRAVTGNIPSDWQELVNMICPDQVIEHLPNQIWLKGQQLSLPIKADVDRIQDLSDQFLAAAETASCSLIELQCVAVFPPEFNTKIEQFGNKATLLSTETLKIVRSLMDLADDDLEIGCDKHGGRSKYAGLIQSLLTKEFVSIGEETSDISDYCFRENNRDVAIRFQAKGESFLPTALASMVSKYVREIFMILWNDFWKTYVPTIKPTKGYPLDAKRFKAEIELFQFDMGIDDHSIWRNR